MTRIVAIFIVAKVFTGGRAMGCNSLLNADRDQLSI